MEKEKEGRKIWKSMVVKINEEYIGKGGGDGGGKRTKKVM